MFNNVYGLPLWVVIIAGVLVGTFIIYLIIRAMREGREISFWPPRIGPIVNMKLEAGEQGDKYRSGIKRNEALLRIKKSPLQKEYDIRALYPELPSKGYTKLWGREREIEKIINILKRQDGKRLVAISGLGGIGKTALAREIVDLCLRKKLFENIIWITTQEEVFVGGKAHPLSQSSLSFISLLDTIATQLGHKEIIKERILNEKRKAVKLLLETTSTLIVLDNLETVENYKSLLINIVTLPAVKSRVLITSRPQLTDYDEIFCILLSGLAEGDALPFLRQEAVERGIEAIVKADDAILLAIYQATGGSPLSMKLVASQMSYLSIDTVLQNLKEAKGDMELMYAFIFRKTWTLLSSPARKVLLSMPAFPSSARYSEIEHVSTVEEADLTDALKELIRMSILDVNEAVSASKKKYSIHPLTRSFLKTELTQKWLKMKRI